MALTFRVCIDKLSLNGSFNRLYKVPKYSNVQVAHISGKMNRIKVPRPPPFPYHKKIFPGFHWYNYSLARYDENSKIVVVEGPIAAGKDAFARELALQLEMGYVPAPSLELYSKTIYGFDITSIDHVLPEHAQTCDLERFLTNPKHKNAAAFQTACYMVKFHAYLEALLHLFSTGEGVVLNRCLYSDFVFMKAMYNAGYINRKCRDFYDKFVSRMSLCTLKPHLVIYLDVPVNVVKERIKKRSIPYEVNSKVLTTKYLTDIETIYKEEYLPQIENHSYVLMYDWSCGGDIEDVVEDIERIDLKYSKQLPDKLEDWVFRNQNTVKIMSKFLRRDMRHWLILNFMLNDFDTEEMYLIGEDYEKWCELIAPHIQKYSEGYDPDKYNVLWKTKVDTSFYYPSVIGNKDLQVLQ